MQKFTLGLLILLIVAGNVKAQSIQWMSLTEAEAALKKQARPLLIDLYTDWCGWCKVMDKNTYSNKNVIAYIAKNFYAVKLDAETRSTLNWMGKAYRFNANYRTNDLTIYFTQGKLSYPTTVIIPTDNSGPQPIPGYLEPKNIELVLKYFGEGKYGKQPFREYQRSFNASW
jgi:thioredoxin-related protein